MQPCAFAAVVAYPPALANKQVGAIDGQAREIATQGFEVFGARRRRRPASLLAHDARDGMERHHTSPRTFVSRLRNPKGKGNSPRTPVRNILALAESPQPTEIGYAGRLWIDHSIVRAARFASEQVLPPDVIVADEICVPSWGM